MGKAFSNDILAKKKNPIKAKDTLFKNSYMDILREPLAIILLALYIIYLFISKDYTHFSDFFFPRCQYECIFQYTYTYISFFNEIYTFI